MAIDLYEMVYEPDPNHIRHIHQVLNIPTEFVVKEPKLLVPQQARIFSTRLWILDDQVVGYDTLAQEENFRGTSYYDEVLCVEVWCENGDDGHVNYALKGWMYVTQSRIDGELKELDSWDSLPLCMRWGYDYKKYYDLYHSREEQNAEH